jgi:DNA-binding NtrC family response regulator
VRELRNAVARYVALGDEPEPISVSASVPPSASSPTANRGDAIDEIVASKLPFPLARRKTLQEFERRYVEAVLAAHGGNVAKAARASGLALRYFRLVKGRARRG